MQAIPTALAGVLILEPTVFGDARGFFLESYNRRRPAVAAGTVRVRYVAARCPSPDLPATTATGSVGDGAGVELAPAAGLDVLDLREALIRDRAKIDYLQAYIRKITEPVGLGLRALPR